MRTFIFGLFSKLGPLCRSHFRTKNCICFSKTSLNMMNFWLRDDFLTRIIRSRCCLAKAMVVSKYNAWNSIQGEWYRTIIVIRFQKRTFLFFFSISFIASYLKKRRARKILTIIAWKLRKFGIKICRLSPSSAGAFWVISDKLQSVPKKYDFWFQKISLKSEIRPLIQHLLKILLWIFFCSFLHTLFC